MSRSPKDQQFHKVIVVVECQYVEIGWLYDHTAHSQVRENSRFYPFRLRMSNSPSHTCVLIFFRLFVHVVPVRVVLSCVVPRHRKDAAVCSRSKPKRDNAAVSNAAPPTTATAPAPPSPICLYLMFPTTEPGREALLSPSLVHGGGVWGAR